MTDTIKATLYALRSTVILAVAGSIVLGWPAALTYIISNL